MDERAMRLAAEEWLIMSADERADAMRDRPSRERYAPLNDAIFHAPPGNGSEEPDHKTLIEEVYGVQSTVGQRPFELPNTSTPSRATRRLRESEPPVASRQGRKMRHFQANTHVNPRFVEFVGDSWDDGGWHVNDEGEPISDCRGNTVARFEVREIEERDAELLAQEFAGDEPIDNPGHFVSHLCRTHGLLPSLTRRITKRLGLAVTGDHWFALASDLWGDLHADTTEGAIYNAVLSQEALEGDA